MNIGKHYRLRLCALNWGLSLISVLLLIGGCSKNNNYPSTRQERRAINEGNRFYKQSKYAEASSKYQLALKENSLSNVAKFNLGLSTIGLARGIENNDSLKGQLAQQGVASLTEVAQLGEHRPLLASKANYDLGNLSMESENYAQAIQLYQQALRLNPQFEEARRNLRIAQLKKKDQDQNQDQNQDQKQDQENNQNQDNNQDQKEQPNKDEQQAQQTPPKEREINPQTAQQILNAVENNENMTRARIGNGEQSSGSAGSNSRNW